MSRFIDIPVFPLQQKDHFFYVGKMKASLLLDYHTVRPAEYDIEKNTSFANKFADEAEYYKYLIEEDKRLIDHKDFQRTATQERVNEITEYLNVEEYSFFPNAIIANCDLINDYGKLGYDEYSEIEEIERDPNVPEHLSFLKKLSNGSYIIYVPKKSDSILIIDGQHRLKGLESTSSSIKDNYELLVSFIVGYDRSVVAKLFYTINYTQKSVNKSLLYHLSGEFSSDLNETTFLHETVKMLNEIEKSPFYKRIKMLGVTPINTPQHLKSKFSISQAFLIDYLIKTISKGAIRSSYLPIFLFYYQNKEFQIEIIKFIIRYFNAIKNLKPYEWDNPQSSILSKGIGVSACLRVMQILFPYIFVYEYQSKPLKIRNETTSSLMKYLEGFENIDFSEFSGVGSAGSINKISDKILSELKYFNSKNDQSKVTNYRSSDALVEFRQWLVLNCEI